MGPVAFVTFYTPPYGGGVGGGASCDELGSVVLTSHTPDSAPT